MKLDLPAMSCHYQLPIGSKVCSRATTLDWIVELENLFFRESFPRFDVSCSHSFYHLGCRQKDMSEIGYASSSRRSYSFLDHLSPHHQKYGCESFSSCPSL